MWKLIKNHRGAVTVFITLLLIPAILVTGTAVDIAVLYLVRTEVQDADQLALNAVLAEYDELLRDLYALFAVTADDAEITEILHVYLSAALLGEDVTPAMGRLRLLTKSSLVSVTPIEVADANLYNREILRHQIEEYVKFRAPTLAVEKILDKIEKFTKLIPDTKACIQKFELDREVETLMVMYEELYYRLRFHGAYLHDAAVNSDVPKADMSLLVPEGMEVWLAGEITDKLAPLQGHAQTLYTRKEEYTEAKQARDAAQAAYESARSAYQNASEENKSSRRAAMESAKAALDAAELALTKAQNDFESAKIAAMDAVEDVEIAADKQADEVGGQVAAGGSLDLIDYWQGQEYLKDMIYTNTGILGMVAEGIDAVSDLILPARMIGKKVKEFAMAGRLTAISGDNALNVREVKPYLDNLEAMKGLLALVSMQTLIVADDIRRLQAELENCSSALRGNERYGLTYDLKQYEAMFCNTEALIGQYTSVYESVVAGADPYFQRMAAYLGADSLQLAPLDGAGLAKLSDVRTAMDIPLEGSNPAGFDKLRGGRQQAAPYFEVASPQYLRFEDKREVFDLYASLFYQYGTDSYAQKQYNEAKAFAASVFPNIGQKMIEGPLAGIWLDAKGTGMPETMHNQFKSLANSGPGTSEDPITDEKQESLEEISTNGVNVNTSGFDILGSIIDRLNYALDIVTSFVSFAEDGFVDRALLTAYDVNMFSCYTTQDGEAMTGYKYSKNINYMLGFEQEYLIIGSPSETANLAAAAGIIMLIRFVFDFISTFVVPSVSKFLMSVNAGGPVGVVTSAILRIVYASGEAFLDVASLRSGDDVPVFKFLDKHWNFLSPGSIMEDLTDAAKGFAFKTGDAVLDGIVEAANGAFSHSGLFAYCGDADTKKIYGAGQMLELFCKEADKKGLQNTMKQSVEAVFSGIKSAAANPLAQAQKSSDNNKALAAAASGGGEDAGTNALEDIAAGKESKLTQKISEKVEEGLQDALIDFITPSMSYEDYLLVFIFMKSPETLANRTADLIALNLTNVKQNAAVTVGDYEDLPLDTSDVYDMSKARTALGVRTEVSYGLIFLSMPFARQGFDGGGAPPGSLPLVFEHYRGY